MASDFNESVSIEVDWKSTEKKLKKLSDVTKNGFNKGLKAALNETVAPDGGKRMDKFALLKMREQYTVKTTRIAKNNKVMVERATLSKLSASVYTKGRPNALTYFKHSPTAKASAKAALKEGRKAGKKARNKGRTKAGLVRAQNFKRGSLRTIPKAFVATMPNGHYGIFKRRGKSRKNLKQFFGPGTSQMLWNEKVSQAIKKELENRFDKAIDKAIDKIIQKAMK